jgi:DnaB-like helicase N terminal domain/AAA domain
VSQPSAISSALHKPNGQVQGFDTERAVRWERAVLGCLLESPELWSKAGELTADDFQLDWHRKIFSAIADLNEHSSPADIVSVHAQLDDSVPAGAIAALIDGAVPENFRSYVRHLRESTRDKHFHELYAKLGEVKPAEERLAWLDLMRGAIAGEGEAQNWRGIFHTVEEFENAPPLRFAIAGFLQEAGVTLIGGLAGHGKTLLMLAMTKALLEESPLFGYEPFSVPHPAQRVLYLIPESSLGPFWSRIKLFRLEEHIRNDRLLVRTLSSREQVSLKDSRLFKAAEGADVFLDTAVRFMDGSENDVESTRPFVQTLFDLLKIGGARTITGAHHAPKGFEGQDYMTLENILRGSGDIGAMLSTAWGVRQIDPARNQLYVQNIKPRDFDACQPFILEARPHLDIAGQFKMLAAPGEAGELSDHLPRRKGGRPPAADKADKVLQAAQLRAQGVSLRETAEKLEVSKSCISKWLFEYDRTVH